MALWKTKTFWGCIAGIATGIGLCFAGNIPEGVATVAISIQNIFKRDAVRKIEERV